MKTVLMVMLICSWDNPPSCDEVYTEKMTLAQCIKEDEFNKKDFGDKDHPDHSLCHFFVKCIEEM